MASVRGVCIAVGMHAYCQGLGSTRAHACHTPAHAHMHNAYIHTCIHTPKRYTQLSAKATSIQGKASCFLLYKATEDGGGVVEIVDLTRRQRGVVGGPGVEFMGRKIKSTEDPSAWAMVRLFPSFGSARFFSRSFFFLGGGFKGVTLGCCCCRCFSLLLTVHCWCSCTQCWPLTVHCWCSCTQCWPLTVHCSCSCTQCWSEEEAQEAWDDLMTGEPCIYISSSKV